MNQEPENEWAEDLPPNCPPEAARHPAGELFFRLVSQFPPTEEDFYSHRRLLPDRRYLDECVAGSISVFDNFEECSKIRAFPTHRRKLVVEINLPPESGVLLSTMRRPAHFSWWRSKAYDPLVNCRVSGSKATEPGK